MFKTFCAVAAITFAAPIASALPEAFFDFEDVAPFTLAPFSLTDSGQEIVFDRGADVAVIELSADGFPAEVGSRFLRVPLDGPNEPLVISFTSGVTGVSFDLGLSGFFDFPNDIRFEYYSGQDGTGSLIESSVINVNSNWTMGESPQNVSFSFLAPTNALGSVVIQSDGAPFAPFGFAMDNITVIIPAPGSALLLGAIGAIAGPRRRRLVPITA